jgi:3-oxoadipate enol-lactonase
VNSQQGFVDANGTRLYYEMAGAGEGVVLLHGFTLDTRMWDDQFALFAGRFQVIRYDLGGFGQSALPTDAPYTHFEDLKGLLDALGIEQPHLVGLSKGGGVALDFALAFPQRVRSLVLIDTVLGGFAWSAAGSARDEAVWQAAAAGGIAAAKASWLAHPLFAPALRQPEVAARLKQILDDYSGITRTAGGVQSSRTRGNRAIRDPSARWPRTAAQSPRPLGRKSVHALGRKIVSSPRLCM